MVCLMHRFHGKMFALALCSFSVQSPECCTVAITEIRRMPRLLNTLMLIFFFFLIKVTQIRGYSSYCSNQFFLDVYLCEMFHGRGKKPTTLWQNTKFITFLDYVILVSQIKAFSQFLSYITITSEEIMQCCFTEQLINFDISVREIS